MPLSRTGYFGLLVLLCAMRADAGRTPQLRLTKTEDLPAIGLRIRLMPDARARPVPPPTVHTYTRTMGGVEERQDRWDPVELWRQGQHAGEWYDEDANLMVLAVVRCPFPDSFSMQHVTHEEYDTKLKAAMAQGVPTTEKAMREWVKYFTGDEVSALEPVTRLPMRMEEATRVRFGETARPRLGYFFRFKRSSVLKSLPLLQYFVLFSLNPDADLAKSERAVESSLIPALTPLRTMSEAELASARPSGVSGPGAPATEPETGGGDLGEGARSREQAKASVRNLEDWWYAETPNYIMLSNLGLRHKLTVKKIQAQIETVREIYEKLVPPKCRIEAVCVVRMFDTPRGYVSYVGKEYEWTGGLWASGRKELVLRPMVGGSKLEARKQAIRVMYHEAFHQYLFYAFNRIRTSPWFNEGHAVFFEGIGSRSNRIIIEEHEQSAEIMDGLARGSRIRLEPLLAMDYDTFYDPDDDVRRRNYALAWALVYYLQKGARAEKRDDYREILDRYANAVWETRDPRQATTAAFAEVDTEAFERDFTDFWQSRNRRSAARRYSLFK